MAVVYIKALLHPCFFAVFAYCISIARIWGRTGFDGDVEAGIAGRGAAGLVKSGNQVIGNDYEYAYAA